MILLCSLVIIIFLHELGHLWAAKLCKCGVTTFSVGFGNPIFKKTINNTVYQITPILLGGYCSLKGELDFSNEPDDFTNKRYFQKVFISYAGILINIITGLISVLIYFLTYNQIFLYFAFYSISIGLSNALPIPALDGSYPIAFLFEKKLGKQRLYSILHSLFSKWLQWILIINILTLPYLAWMIYTGQIL